MNSSPTRQGTLSSNNSKSNNNAGPPTLLQVVAGLSASLKTAFEPARSSGSSSSRDAHYDSTLLHSLAVESTKDLKLPLELLTSTLSAFEEQVLNEQGSIPSANNDKLRLLALSKEHSTLQLQDLQNKHGTNLAKRVLERRALYPTFFPFSVKEGWTIQDVLENIARECGLEIFPGAEEDGAGTDGMMLDEANAASESSSTSTLTMAGKGIVLDIDVENKTKVRAVRFSYGLEGSTDGGIDKLLSKQAKEGDWEAMRNSLMKLARIDRLVTGSAEGEQASVDPFSATKTITIKLEQLFQAELEIASSPSELLTRGHGLAITHFGEPYTILLYYLPILDTYSDVWQEAVQSGLQAEAMHKLLSLDGAISLRIEVAVGKLDRSTEAQASPDISLLGMDTGDLDADSAEELHYVARLNKPLLVSQAAGRILEGIVTGREVAAAPRSHSVPSENTFLTRLLPKTPPGVRYDLGEADINIQASLAHSDERAFQITSLPFSSVSQLWRIIEVIRRQRIFNELLTNLFEGAKVSEKVDEEAITLEDLMSDNDQEAVSLFLEANLDNFPPVLHVSYLLPHLPGWIALSISLRIQLSSQIPSGLKIQHDLHGGRPELVERVSAVLKRDDGDNRLQSVLGVTRDIRRCVGFINKRLAQAKAEILHGLNKPGLP